MKVLADFCFVSSVCAGRSTLMSALLYDFRPPVVNVEEEKMIAAFFVRIVCVNDCIYLLRYMCVERLLMQDSSVGSLSAKWHVGRLKNSELISR